APRADTSAGRHVVAVRADDGLGRGGGRRRRRHPSAPQPLRRRAPGPGRRPDRRAAGADERCAAPEASDLLPDCTRPEGADLRHRRPAPGQRGCRNVHPPGRVHRREDGEEGPPRGHHHGHAPQGSVRRLEDRRAPRSAVIPWRLVAALVIVSLGAVPLEARTFESLFTGPARPLGQALTGTVARSLPVLSASPGLTFTYDPSSGAYERSTDLLGQLYLERAQPIGQGKWNVSATYEGVEFNGVQGEDVGDLHDSRLPIILPGAHPSKGTGFLLRFNRYAVALTVDEMTFQSTYGITDDLEVNLTLPVLFSRLSIGSMAQTFTRNTSDNSLVPIPPGQRGTRFEQDISHATGVGDMLLRGKYRFLKFDWVDAAAGLVVRMPTGSEENFQGTGSWEFSPLLYLSTPRIPIAGPVAFQGFVNGGFDLVVNDVDVSEGRIGAGFDLAFWDRATFSIAFLGREPFHGFAPAGFFDKPRYNPSNGCPVSSPSCGHPVAPIFGLSTVRPSYYSLSIGGRGDLLDDTLFGFGTALLPPSHSADQTAPPPLARPP